MITLPTLPAIRTKTETVTAFLGLDRTALAAPNSLSDMENLSARAYPHLAPRRPRGTYAVPHAPTALLARKELCCADGAAFLIGDRRVDMGLSAGDKQLVSFGDYVIILPDRKYIRTADGAWGEIDAEAASPEGARVTLTLCRADGSPLPTEPTAAPVPSPTGGELWLDTTDLTPILYRFAPETERWTPVRETYLRLTAKGIGAPFAAGDSVHIQGLTSPDLRALNTTHTLSARGENFLVFRGILPHAYAQTGVVTAARRMPRLDFLLASGDRLWGCFSGRDENGDMCCELRASRRGDFRNWEGGEGEEAAFALDIRVDGPFTAACDYLGSPHFFTERSITRVTGDRPAAFRVHTVPAEGVEAESERSLALAGDTLFYKSTEAVCAYRGNRPTRVSLPLGDTRFRHAAAGALGSRYYISMQETDTGIHHLFVYDTARELWHREDSTHARAFAAHRGELYFIDGTTAAVRTVNGTGAPERTPIRWMAQTQPFAASTASPYRPARIDLRLRLPQNGRIDCLIEYNSDGEWHHLQTLSGDIRTIARIAIPPHPCDHFRLRLLGEGDAEILSLSRIAIKKG